MRRTHRNLRPEVYTISVHKPGSCPARMAAGDCVRLIGQVFRADCTRFCAFAMAEVAPFVRRGQRLLDAGKKTLPVEPIFCSHCPEPANPAEFRLSYRPLSEDGGAGHFSELQRRGQLLKRFPLLAPLPGATLGRIAHQLKTVSYFPGRVILRKGQRGDQLFLIDRGEVEVVGEDGERLAKIGAGECFGEMSLLTSEPVSATIKALSEVHLLGLAGRDFDALLTRNPAINAYFTRLLSSRLKKSSAAPHITEGMAGQLDDFQVSDLLQALHMTNRSGRLRMQHDAAEVDIFFLEGQPVRIEAHGGAPEDPEEAVYEAISWERGRFRFEKLAAKVERTFFGDLMSLLLEGMRRTDELRLAWGDDAVE